jgi:hypothetical protein
VLGVFKIESWEPFACTSDFCPLSS